MPNESTVIIERQAAQSYVAWGLRACVSFGVIALLVILNGWRWWLAPSLVVLVVAYVVQVKRHRRHALHLDAHGIREDLPGYQGRFTGVKPVALAWPEVSAIWVLEGRWSSKVQIGARGLTWTLVVPRRWKVIADPEFDQKVAVIKEVWAAYTATLPPPAPEPMPPYPGAATPGGA